MAWQQVVTPNLGITYTGGECLKAVADAYGIAWNSPDRYAAALLDWNANNGNHPGELPPTGVAVPVYFSLTNIAAGHVAIALPDGRVASSTMPGIHDGFYIHPSLTDLISMYSNQTNGTCSYLGWSETVDRLQVVQQGGSEVTTDQDFQNCFITQAQRWPTSDELAQWHQSGLEAYEWVQKFAPNPILEAQQLEAFKDCWITQAGTWPAQADIDAWKASQLPGYTYVQQHAPNPALQDALTKLATETDLANRQAIAIRQASDQIAALQEQVKKLAPAPLPPVIGPASIPQKVSWWIRFIGWLSS